MKKKDKCPECQFEDGDHSQGCSKYEDKPLSVPESPETAKQRFEVNNSLSEIEKTQLRASVPEGNGKASGGLSILKYPKLSVPEKEEAATPTVQHSMKCPKLYGETCTCTPQKEERCKTSPLCSHNTNCRDLDKPCSISFPKPPKEEVWAEQIKRIWSNALDDETERRYGMSKHHPPDDCPPWFIKEISSLLSQTKSTTRRETLEEVKRIIESMKMEEAPPFSADDAYREQATLINEHLMPSVKEKLLTTINRIT